MEYSYKTQLGQEVARNQFPDLKTLILTGRRIKETAIVDAFQEKLQHIIFASRRVSKTVASGKIARHSVLVALGNRAGIIGLGKGKSADRQTAVKKAVNQAKKSLIVIKLGNHRNERTIPQKRVAKVANSSVTVQPVSLRTGIVGGKYLKLFCQLAGIPDIRVKLSGASNRLNYIKALYLALKGE